LGNKSRDFHDQYGGDLCISSRGMAVFLGAIDCDVVRDPSYGANTAVPAGFVASLAVGNVRCLASIIAV
jgi:hypothetical protein